MRPAFEPLNRVLIIRTRRSSRSQMRNAWPKTWDMTISASASTSGISGRRRMSNVSSKAPASASLSFRRATMRRREVCRSWRHRRGRDSDERSRIRLTPRALRRAVRSRNIFRPVATRFDLFLGSAEHRGSKRASFRSRLAGQQLPHLTGARAPVRVPTSSILWPADHRRFETRCGASYRSKPRAASVR